MRGAFAAPEAPIVLGRRGCLRPALRLKSPGVERRTTTSNKEVALSDDYTEQLRQLAESGTELSPIQRMALGYAQNHENEVARDAAESMEDDK